MTEQTVTQPRSEARPIFAVEMPVRLMLALVALGLQRTILADLGVVEPESSWVYYVLALTPFAAWAGAAAFRRSRTPLQDQLATGALYRLSLIVVHETLRATGLAVVEHPPFAQACLVAMSIGVGFGLFAGAIAMVGNRIRRSRAG